MRLRRTIVFGLALLVAAGLGVCQAAAQGTARKSSSRSSSGGKAHRSSKKTRSRGREKGQKAPTPDRIVEIQQALAKDGSFEGAPNGKWNDASVEGMKKFQAAHGLNPTGKLDARTLEKLGLGSQTAGIAAPIPPINSTSRLTGAPQTAESQ